MSSDEQDNAGVVAPPPLIYLGALLFGLLLNRRFPIAFLPRRIARSLGWTLLCSGVLLLGWFEWTLRHAGTPATPLIFR
jgi:protein-S-isoprenylcysteine O-methyltransferase Ste14